MNQNSSSTPTAANFPEDWAMYSPEGDALVGDEMALLAQGARAGDFSREELAGQVTAFMDTIEASGHGEVYDTAVRECIAEALNELCEELSWAPIEEL